MQQLGHLAGRAAPSREVIPYLRPALCAKIHSKTAAVVCASQHGQYSPICLVLRCHTDSILY